MRTTGSVSGDVPIWRALGAMLVVGTIALILLARVFQLAAPVAMSAWSVAAAYGAAGVLGLRLAHPSARAVIRGDWIFGPLLGGTLYVAGVLVGGIVHGLGEGVTPASALRELVEPMIGFLIVGTIPALMVGGVFSLVLAPVKAWPLEDVRPAFRALPPRPHAEENVEEDTQVDVFRVR
jgi:hypothetical protein